MKKAKAPNSRQEFILTHLERERWDELSSFVLHSDYKLLDQTGYWNHYGGELMENTKLNRERKRYVVPQWVPPFTHKMLREGFSEEVLDHRTMRYIETHRAKDSSLAFASNHPITGRLIVAFSPNVSLTAMERFIRQKGYRVAISNVDEIIRTTAHRNK